MKMGRAVFFGVAVFVLTFAARPASAGFSGSDVFLPMAGRQAGVFPSNWYTTVWIHNPGAAAATARIYLLERSTANPSPPWVDVLVAPGDTEKIENIVEELFHKEVFGALRVTCGTQKLVVTSRVYSKGSGAGEKDSVGQDFAGVPASFAIGVGERSQVLGVHQTLPSAVSDHRFNFGFVETTGRTATVRVRAFDGNGADKGFTDLTVREWSQRQAAFKDHFPTVSTENARLEVEVIAGAGRVIAYGSGIANGSQDPTTFEMTYADTLLGIAAVQHDSTLTGDGSAAAPLGLADGAVTDGKVAGGIAYGKLAGAPTSLPPSGPAGGSLAGAYPNPGIADGAVTDAKVAGGIAYGKLAGAPTTLPPSGPAGGSLAGTYPNPGIANGAVAKATLAATGAGTAGQVLGTIGSGLSWQDDGLALPFSRTVSTAGGGIDITNTHAVGYGIKSRGSAAGGYFKDANDSGYAHVGYSDWGIFAHGDSAGGIFEDLNSSSYGFVGYGTYKIFGSGTVSFVQNHPEDAGAVIVYAAPEGDEVATYTRGSARLAGGEARVALGETFKWVTNPDLGLTAYLTPVGGWCDLYVAEKGTEALVVRSRDGSDCAFDYAVFGLRIGFEESTIVQEKQRQAYIPAMTEHRERLARRPELGRYTALERFGAERKGLGAVTALDLSRAGALKAAIHEFNPAVDRIDETPASEEEPAPAEAHATPGSQRLASVPASRPDSPPEVSPAPARRWDSVGAAQLRAADRADLVDVAGAVEAGDVLVIDAAAAGALRRSGKAEDRAVAGVAAGGGEHRAPVAFTGVAMCKVDASFGAVLPGDLLVTSPTPGHAMRHEAPSPGAVLGKALQGVATGRESIRILVTLR